MSKELSKGRSGSTVRRTARVLVVTSSAKAADFVGALRQSGHDVVHTDSSATGCAHSSPITSPSSPSVKVTTNTCAPSARYRAMVPPVMIVSSSGCGATTRMSRGTMRLHSGGRGKW